MTYKQKGRTKINPAYSSWEEIFFRFYKDSSLILSYLNFVSDLFIIMNKKDFACSTDDNTLYVVALNIKYHPLTLTLVELWQFALEINIQK